MKKTLVMLSIYILIFTAVVSPGEFTISESIEKDKIGIMESEFEKLDLKVINFNKLTSSIGDDTQVTFSDFDECHPALDIDYNGNPFLLYEVKEDFFNSDIYMQKSQDGGETWPNDMVWSWTIEDTGDINPDISFVDDGVYAFGTHETREQDPTIYIHHYPDIDDPNSWSFGYFDRTDTSNFVKETAVTTSGLNTVAIGSILDYHTDDYDLEQTVLINWNTNLGEDSWPGVIWLIEEDPCSQLCAAAGEKVFFCFQRETNGKSRIWDAYCKVDESTTYENWRLATVASSTGNCTNPDIAVSGKNAYVVYMDDRNGNQDIHCSTSTSGSFWKRHIITDSIDDETYPVISANGEKATCLFFKNNNLYKTQTEDFGDTWSTPVMVNDVSDTVVSGYDYSAIKGPYGAWTDNRNENNDIFFESVGATPILNIDEISGGFGVTVTVSNIGNAPAENTQWSINLDGDLILFGQSAEGTISTLAEGESITIRIPFVLGLGNVLISATVGDEIKTANGKLILFFVTGLV